MSSTNVRVLEGRLDATGKSFAIIVSRFNSLVTDKLVAGAVDMLVRHGASEDDITVIKVPGSWEIPPVLRKVLEGGKKFDGIVCLGAVIRGSTPHFEYVSAEVAKGIAQLSMRFDTPVGFGVLTCDTLEQALERAGSKMGNKGAEAAAAVLELCGLDSQLENL